jgi:hypothetical protein
MWQNLTPELVFGIFGHFLPGLKLSVTEPAQFPWYLGHICSRWRDVFISYPAFWSNFIIYLELDYDIYGEPRTIHEPDVTRALAILNVCLPRGGNGPFSFKLVLYSYDLRYGSDQSSKSRCGLQVLELLVGQSNRWHDAHIELCESGLPILYMVKDRLPILRSVRVNIWSCGAASMRTPSSNYIDLFEDASQLKCLHAGVFTWRVDWSALTVVHLRYPYRVSMHLEALSRCSRLEELNIYGRFRMHLDPIPVALPFLKILRTGSERALQLFQMPMLQELCIKRITDLRRPDGTSFADTISSCLPSLLHLTKLTLCTNRTGDVELILQYMPAVSDLCLYICEPIIVTSEHRTEKCLRVSGTGFLKLLTESPKSQYLKTLTVGLLRCDENYLADITTWIKRKSLPDDVHRFDELEHLSLVFDAWDYTHFFGVVRQHLEAEGIQNSIRKINNEDDNIVFDFFTNWDELWDA